MGWSKIYSRASEGAVNSPAGLGLRPGSDPRGIPPESSLGKCHILLGGGLPKIGGIGYFFLDQQILLN